MKHSRSIITRLIAFVIGTLACTLTTTAGESTKKQLLELTGGRRVKVAWALDKGALKYYDTKTDVIKTLPFSGNVNKTVLLTSDGQYILSSVGELDQRQVMAYNTETGKVIKTPKAPCNNLLAVWTDPKTKVIWVYVNAVGDKKRGWKATAREVYRFPLGKPEKRELFWNRTRSHLYLNFSADGTRACFEPNWGNIGELKLAFGSGGKTDQENSTYKKFGGGCYPAMAPDNSYRLFILQGSHRSITMYDEGGKNPRNISVSRMLKPGKSRRTRGSAWLTYWSTDVQYMTIMAPEHDSEYHGTSQIYLGRFDKGHTKIEKWVLVSNHKDGKSRRSHAWIAPAK